MGMMFGEVRVGDSVREKERDSMERCCFLLVLSVVLSSSSDEVAPRTLVFKESGACAVVALVGLCEGVSALVCDAVEVGVDASDADAGVACERG